jgi:hypothetical protein
MPKLNYLTRFLKIPPGQPDRSETKFFQSGQNACGVGGIGADQYIDVNGVPGGAKLRQRISPDDDKINLMFVE